MKINDSVSKTAGLTTNSIDTKSSKPDTLSKAPGGASETVTLSSGSSQMQSLGAIVAADDGFDVNKVEQIKSAISDGQFKIDSGKVADGLITSVRDMLSAQRA